MNQTITRLLKFSINSLVPLLKDTCPVNKDIRGFFTIIPEMSYGVFWIPVTIRCHRISWIPAFPNDGPASLPSVWYNGSHEWTVSVSSPALPFGEVFLLFQEPQANGAQRIVRVHPDKQHDLIDPYFPERNRSRFMSVFSSLWNCSIVAWSWYSSMPFQPSPGPCSRRCWLQYRQS
jgi:hypothetical protein